MTKPTLGHIRFVLLAAAILLAGAAAAGLAAQAVIAPQTGQVRSGGAVSIPTVLGQTAEEVLFYPWSVYEAEQRTQAEDLLSQEGTTLAELPAFQAALDLLGVAAPDTQALDQALELSQQYDHLFLREFPGKLEGGTAVALNYAISLSAPYSVSFVLSPAEGEQISQARQNAALARVKDDLKTFLCGDDREDGLAFRLAELLYALYSSGYEQFGYPIQSLLSWRTEWCWPDAPGALDKSAQDWTLDELIAQLEQSYGLSVQLITTPSQIVALITLSGQITGIYYDIQLGQYSGFGSSF